MLICQSHGFIQAPLGGIPLKVSSLPPSPPPKKNYQSLKLRSTFKTFSAYSEYIFEKKKLLASLAIM